MFDFKYYALCCLPNRVPTCLDEAGMAAAYPTAM